jgi:transitional endoplasmic reticulum ATPase
MAGVGPPGAGKTTFAKAVTSRLDWAFVEVFPSLRRGDPPSPLQAETDELLEIIPAFRDRPDRLLVCAANFIRSPGSRSGGTAEHM